MTLQTLNLESVCKNRFSESGYPLSDLSSIVAGGKKVCCLDLILYLLLQHAATRCNTLQHAATRCNALQQAATHCNTLQHTATHCNTLQHTATCCNTSNTVQHTQHTATTHCSTLQYIATHCSTLQHAIAATHLCVSLVLYQLFYRVANRTRRPDHTGHLLQTRHNLLVVFSCMRSVFSAALCYPVVSLQ